MRRTRQESEGVGRSRKESEGVRRALKGSEGLRRTREEGGANQKDVEGLCQKESEGVRGSQSEGVRVRRSQKELEGVERSQKESEAISHRGMMTSVAIRSTQKHSGSNLAPRDPDEDDDAAEDDECRHNGHADAVPGRFVEMPREMAGRCPGDLGRLRGGRRRRTRCRACLECGTGMGWCNGRRARRVW